MKYTEIIKKVRKIVRSINLESKQIQKEYGVSIPQILCLTYLGEQPRLYASHKEIAAFLELNSSTVTGIINRLENKALVARLPNIEDKRSTNIAITSAGKKLMDDAPDLLHNRLMLKLKDLNQDDLILISRGLDILIDNLGIGEIDASPLLTIEHDLDQINNSSIE
ncbi:MAG: MarR family transcriptional regulator [Marinilabiliaceae bacterium]|jgi:DNA-binding MarR family transcriptional regulator|nr:MarR family transcriptional regulator [Marinilabiliaceae bacterium]